MKNIILLAILMLATTACATLTSTDGARLGVMYATAKVIDTDQGKAAKVLEITQYVRARMDDERLTVDALDAAVRKQVPWAQLDVADQLLADALLVELRAQLEQRVGTGILDRQKRLNVLAVLSWVERSAQMSL